MSFVKRPDLAHLLQAPETDVFSVVNGPLAALSIEVSRDPVTNILAFHCHARALTATGALLDAKGEPVRSAITWSASSAFVESLGGLVVMLELIRALLGEPPGLKAGSAEPLIAFADFARRDASIKQAIAAAQMTGVIPLNNLL